MNSDWYPVLLRFAVTALSVIVLVDMGGLFLNFLGFRFEIV